MRLLKLSLRGLTVFSGTVELDFDALGPGLIALTGRNGSGKSTLMGAPIAAMHRVLPDRPGHLQDYCTGDAFVEAVFEDGGDTIAVRVAVDADHRRTESYLLVNGQSVHTGRSAEHAAEIERRFGSLALMLVSVFASQAKQGNFLCATKGQRKELFAELLALGSLEAAAEQARARATEASAQLTEARFVVSSLEGDAARLESLRSDLIFAEGAVTEAVEASALARDAETEAVAAVERARSSEARMASLRAAVTAALREKMSADTAVVEARGLAGKAERDADEKLRLIDAGKPEGLEAAARSRHAAALAALTRRVVKYDPADLIDEPAAEALLTTARSSLATAQGLKQERRLALLQLESAESTLERDRARLSRQAGLVGDVPCQEQPALVSACPLLADARGAAASLAALQEPADLRAKVGVLDARLAGSDSVEAIQAGIGTLEASLERARAARRAQEAAEQVAAERAEADAALAAELDAAREAVRLAAQARQEIAAARADAIRAAARRVEAAEVAARDAASRHGAAVAAAAEVEMEADLRTAERILADSTTARKMAETAQREADIARARLAAQVETIEDHLRALPAHQQRAAGFETDVADWTLLARALGKDGVQALEIDAAGPEVARLANDLLAVYPGRQFSVAFETLRAKKSARGEFTESFDVRVFVDGDERAVEALSGGEKVVVGEAIGLAIAIFNARKSGVRWATLWRDETAGALDPASAAAYVLMLRRARELAGAYQVIFVAHQSEVTEAADVRIEVAGGQARVAA